MVGAACYASRHLVWQLRRRPRCAAHCARAVSGGSHGSGKAWQQLRAAAGRDEVAALSTVVAGICGGAAVWWLCAGRSLRSGGAPGDQDMDEDDYGDVEYWEARYRATDGEPLDWLGNLADLEPWIRQSTAGARRILHLGCGTSILPEEMHDAGSFGEVCNVDSSASCLEAMRQRNAVRRPSLRWVLADVRDMRGVFPDGGFDCAIEKSTLDSVCDGGRDEEAARYVAEVARVLRPGGTFLVISFAPPAARLQYLESLFSCEAEVAAGRCWAYSCRKRPVVANASSLPGSTAVADAPGVGAQAMHAEKATATLHDN